MRWRSSARSWYSVALIPDVTMTLYRDAIFRASVRGPYAVSFVEMVKYAAGPVSKLAARFCDRLQRIQVFD